MLKQPPKITADIKISWSSPDHNKEIHLELNGLYGHAIPSNNMFEWSVEDLDGNEIDAGVVNTLDEAKKIVESVMKEHKGNSRCRSCGRTVKDPSGLCPKCDKSESEATAAPKKPTKPAVTFTESELDVLLSKDAIDQEVKKMVAKGVAPSQRVQFKEITADVTEAVRWQENKNQELHEMKTNDTKNENPWIVDLTEDFVTYGLSPANTTDEAKIILENLDNDLKAQAEAGFGPEARNYISSLRKELELLIEKL